MEPYIKRQFHVLESSKKIGRLLRKTYSIISMGNINSRVYVYESLFLLQQNDKSLGEDYSFSEGMLDEISITLILMM